MYVLVGKFMMQPFADIGRVNREIDHRMLAVGVERNIVQQVFQHRVQSAGADILLIFIGKVRIFGDLVKRLIGKRQANIVRRQQCRVLLRDGIFRLGQNRFEIRL